MALAWNDIQGQWIKWKVRYLKGFRIVGGLNDSPRSTKIVVSLTSYGRRVSKTVPYTLASLLKQTTKPDRIILWLDNEHWHEGNIPQHLKQLRNCGVEIRFCQDYRSYKKLLPSLALCPEEIIITVDDDIYYSPHLIERMYESYMKSPECVHCVVAHEPLLENDGSLRPYDDWRKDVCETFSGRLFPVGWGGVLYPPGTLWKDVADYGLAQRMAPAADDIWFWGMALVKGTNHRLVDFKGCTNYTLDSIYQYFHSESALTHQNVKEGRNDKQLKAVCSNYHLFEK